MLLTARTRAVIHAPFAPFIVLFCNVIATSDVDDLQRLEMFVSTLEPFAEASRSASNFYRLCYIFHKVATLYIDGKTDSMLVGNSEFDQYLNVLGFGHNLQDGSELESWFNGNQFMMGLMEQDLSYLDAQFPTST
jgi:hypothetical protein